MKEEAGSFDWRYFEYKRVVFKLCAHYVIFLELNSVPKNSCDLLSAELDKKMK
ncbi:MAG: hypothetical protein AB8B80_09185 [Marinicellaceae bacterium]